MKKQYLLFLALSLTLSSAFSQVPNYVPTSGLVGWWPFNGNANDASGNGNNGTVNGSTLTPDRFGNSNSAFSFDGNDWITLPNIIPVQIGTVSFWVNTNSNLAQILLYHSNSNGDDGFGSANAGSIEDHTAIGGGGAPYYVFDNSNGVSWTGNPIINIGEWYHIVVTYNNAEAKLYFNGNLINTLNISSETSNNLPTVTYIGRPRLATRFLDGKFDDLGIWNRALTQCEITDLYNASLHVLNVSAGTDQSVCSGTPVTLAGSGASSYSWDNGVTDNTPFTPTASTTYTVTGTDASGCTATDNLVVQVTELPTVTESTNTICPGTQVTLTASSPLSNETPCASEDLPLSLQSGLVGYWPFCGNANDESGNGNNGTVNGQILSNDRFGNVTSSYLFSGNNTQYISLPSNPISGSGNFSISFWFKTNSSSRQGLITLGNESVNNDCIQIFLLNNQLRYDLTMVSGPIGTVNINDNNWHHGLVLNQSGNGYLYIDGAMINSVNSMNPNISNTGTKRFGGDRIGIGNTQTFSGDLDDVGIWNRALTPEEITQLYNVGSQTYSWSTGETTESISVSPTSTSTYTCDVTVNGQTCSGTTTLDVVAPIVSASDSTICSGEPVNLTVSSPLSNKTPCTADGLPTSLQSGLVGYWPFCGNANDESGNGNNGTVNGATLTADRFGNANNAYVFDGVDDYIQCSSNLSSINTVTVSGWAFCTSPMGGSFVHVGQDDGTNCNGFGIGKGGFASAVGLNFWNIYPGNKLISLVSCVTYYDSGQSLTNGNWFHFTVIKQGNSFTYFINGVQVGTQAIGAALAATSKIFFGTTGLLPGSKTFLQGSLDDIGIWNRALSASEVLALYNIGNPTYSWSTAETTAGISVNPTATTTYSCDITVNGQTCSDDVTINVIPNSSSSISETVCNTYTAPDGTVYNTSGTYTAVIPNAAGCDSTITINLTVNNSTSSTISPTACDTYTAPDGTAYSTSGTYTAVIPNAAGCDSTITINLTVNNSTSSTISPTACDTYTAPDGTSYNTSGTYTAVIPNAAGCDSTITINLTVNNSTSSTISPTACDTYTAPDGAVYTSSGTHTAVIPNAAGCDSTITINLTVNNSTSSTISPTACDAYTAPDGAVFTTGGTYTAVIPNAAGCDSTITINLTLNNSTSSTISPTVCDTYTAPDGTAYTTSGTYTAVIPNAIGCDSTITINLTVNNSPTVNAGTDQLVCTGTQITLSASGAQSYTWSNGITNGTPFTPSVGTLNYNVTGTDANGCEGTDNVLVTVTIPPVLNLISTSPECPGEASGTAEALVTGGTVPYSFLWSNGSVSALNNEIPAGTYSVILTDNAGCSESGTVIVTDASEPCFFIPGGLSPNGDGNNDTWSVNGLNAYPDASIMVYNRWGQLLYDAGPDDAPWDGTYLSEELPTADYYYIIDLGNGETFNGVITLKR